jgi:YggT family protein
LNAGSQQSAPFTIRAKAKSRTAKSPFSALFARNFPCLRGVEPIFTRKSNPRPNREQSQPMRAVLEIVLLILDLYVWLLIASAILSWLIAFNVVNTRNQLVAAIAEFLYRITEPLLAPIRNFIPNFGGLDISPIILILLIYLVQKLIVYNVMPLVIGY